ncbi:MAG: hypothetical protein N2544_14370 [Burkholderiales bacterium]|nr:hypothetical protein [Burkholderiales bacterium]
MRERRYAAPRRQPRAAGPEPAQPEPLPNLRSLALIARLAGIEASPDGLAGRFATPGLDIESAAMVRALAELGLAPAVRQGGWAELAREPMPLLAQLRDGSLLPVVEAQGATLRLVRGGELHLEPRDAFLAEWTGRWIAAGGPPWGDAGHTVAAVERALAICTAGTEMGAPASGGKHAGAGEEGAG